MDVLTRWRPLGRALAPSAVARPNWFAHLASWVSPRLSGTAGLPARSGLYLFSGAGRGGGGGGGESGWEDGFPGGYHTPVLADEVVHFLQPAPGKLVMDATLGGGGHAERLLLAGACVLGLDQDPDATAEATVRLARLGMDDRLAIIQSNFRDFGAVLAEAGVSGLDGILVDLGVSSHQIDTPGRGFSFRADGPLDMRMNPAGGATAADLVNALGEGELAELISRFGEERAASRVARAIVAERRKGRIETTSHLAAVVARVVPRRGKSDPATRVFQALRIAVNDELGALADLLEQSIDWLRPGGRLVTITFHSLEDRLVKNFVRSRSSAWTDAPGWPEPRPNPLLSLRPVLRKALTPSPQESARNPRARSAKLRVAERLGY